MPATTLPAQAILRSLDLLVDGPVRWGAPVRSRRPGVFVVELSTVEALAPLDIVAIRTWLERVPGLRLDGERPEPGALADRLRSFWLPGQTVIYVGLAKSLGPRVAALFQTTLGDRRPHSGGHWIRTLSGFDGSRVWWAETDASEEYQDGIIAAIAGSVTPEERAALPPGPILPWANLDSAGGEKRATGITGSLLEVDPAAAPAPVPATTRRAATRTAATRKTATRTTSTRATRAADAAGKPAPERTHVTASGLAALQGELVELTTLRRPEVILRVKNARELGDLRENADYEAARNEQSFLEGRIRALEQLIKTAEVIDGVGTGAVVLGTTVVAEVEGERVTLHIVGSTEASPAEGRISNASPVGKALMGRRAGDEVVIQTPMRDLRYRILEVR